MIEERPFRLHPRRPRYTRDEAKVWSRGFQQLMRLARMTSRAASPAARTGSGRRTGAAFSQRCAVRLTYSPNKLRGQWAAHGRYIERESATSLAPDGSISSTLAEWQRAGDQRLFKIILSPEFGERLDLARLTRDVMEAMEKDVGRPLEWTAAIHRNTDHPHVHIALRGVAAGEPLRFERDYVKHGIRRHAESACTMQLGYRTALDREEAERRETRQPRYTSLDRILATRGPLVTLEPDAAHPREQHLVARMNYLTEIGLAEPAGPMQWNLDPAFATALRDLQRVQDRQRSLAQHAALLSDPRRQFQIITPEATGEITGRVIAHVLDDLTGRPHMLVEGNDGIVYYLPHDEAIAAARASRRLKPNAMIQIRADIVNGRPVRRVTQLSSGHRSQTR